MNRYPLEIFKKKQIVYILSTMRSGSTLLKSLLSNEVDVSHLPEIHFQKYQGMRRPLIRTLAREKNVVLKKPSWIGEKAYPQIPIPGKNIILIRHPYEVIKSIQKMEMTLSEAQQRHESHEILEYWNQTYNRLLSLLSQKNAHCIKYEELTESPVEKTKEIFKFLGIDSKGFDQYSAPKDYKWAWFNDDGGEKIKSLKVERQVHKREDTRLLDLIAQDEVTQNTLRTYNYKTS